MTTKIMLVEDDTNLNEIYAARLIAEGYEIVSAKDGEEALALAVKEHPDLIISDIMMPKISGFDMLDILRETDGIKHTKVIVMTALGQAEDKSRADKLGADRYLVKSQVTLEDVVKTVKEVLNDEPPITVPGGTTASTSVPTDSSSSAPITVATATPAAPTDTVIAQPLIAPTEPAAADDTPTPEPPTDQTPPAIDNQTPAEPADQTQPAPPAADAGQIIIDENGNMTATQAAEDAVAAATSTAAETEQANVMSQIETFVQHQEAPDQPAAEPTPEAAEVPPTTAPTAPTPETEPAAPPEPAANPAPDANAVPADSTTAPAAKRPSPKVIQPLNTAGQKPDLNALLAKEEQKTAAAQPTGSASPTISTAANAPPPPATIDPNHFDPSSISL